MEDNKIIKVMNFETKPKSFLWALTFPFAHNNYTTIGKTIYYPRNRDGVPQSVVEHEKVHMQQMDDIGHFKFYFKYLFCLPFIKNDFRYRMEYEAYKSGSKSEKEIHKILTSFAYGWLRKPKEFK